MDESLDSTQPLKPITRCRRLEKQTGDTLSETKRNF